MTCRSNCQPSVWSVVEDFGDNLKVNVFCNTFVPMLISVCLHLILHYFYKFTNEILW